MFSADLKFPRQRWNYFQGPYKCPCGECETPWYWHFEIVGFGFEYFVDCGTKFFRILTPKWRREWQYG